jgi:hypothetical protein
MLAAPTFLWMATEDARLTISIPPDLHEAFKTKCFLAKPRVTMTDRILEFIAHEVGRPTPKRIDRRKLNRDQREAMDRRDVKPKPRPAK